MQCKMYLQVAETATLHIPFLNTMFTALNGSQFYFHLHMYCIYCAKNFVIKMCFNQTNAMFLSEVVTAFGLPKFKCRIDFKNT